jgi:hypothetical protein
VTRMLEHLARNWGNWASVVGLLFSILAFIFSKRASKAAEQARDSVLRRSLTQDMNDANRTASDIVRFVGIERGDMALLRAGELLNETSYFISRWDAKLSEQSKTNLLRVREQLLSIHEVLVKKPIVEFTPTQKSRLAQSCQQVNVILSEEFGSAMKATDKVD